MYVSRHHPVSTSVPIPHSTISPKWTKKQDQKLKQAVQKYGTQWSLISRKYRFDRSLNSLVKRWHGKLKQQVQKGVQRQSDQSQSQEQKQEINQKSKKNKKQQKKQQKKDQRRSNQRSRSGKQQLNTNRRQTREGSRYRRQINNQKQQKQNGRRGKQIQQESENEDNQESQSEQNDQEDSLEDSQSKFVFQHNWKQYQDSQLKELILGQKILNWDDLASRLKIQDVRQVRKRWQTVIYPSIIESRKIGGCLKYSEQQDIILNRGVKLGMTIAELRKFLPKRTQYSLDARRRRNLKMDQDDIQQHRYWTKKLNAYKFVIKRHEHLQKPVSEDQFVYRSQSE